VRLQNKLQQFLTAQGHSAYQASMASGVSQGTIRKYAADPALVPTQDIVRSVCAGYGIGQEEILEWVVDCTDRAFEYLVFDLGGPNEVRLHLGKAHQSAGLLGLALNDSTRGVGVIIKPDRALEIAAALTRWATQYKE
jgi:transcriptional regulator with XRE-family HTH domain